MSKEANQRWKAANLEQAREACRNWKRNNPKAYLLSRTKASAQKRGIAFDLTADDLGVLPTHCPVLGFELLYGAVGAGNKDPRLASIDRVDNQAGYVQGNVIIVSLRANMLKRDATPAELRMLADFYGRLSNE